MNNNQSAFPNKMGTGSQGMSLRDYFAAKAMHQFLNEAVIPPGSEDEEVNSLFKYVGKLSYKVADAMLEARKETY